MTASGGFDEHTFNKHFGKMSIEEEEKENIEKQSLWWKTFLQPLSSNKHGNKPGSNVVHLNPQCGDASLVRRIIKRLENQHLIKEEEKKQAVASAEKDLRELQSHIGCGVKAYEEKLKAYQDANKIKSDRETSGSSWTVEMLASYVQPQDVEFILPPQDEDENENENEDETKRIEELIEKIYDKCIALDNAIGHQLKTEYDTRMLLDAILHPLCVKEGLEICTEQTLKCDFLPTSKPDYIIYYQGIKIGVVEAKRAGYLTEKSVVQLILQLISVSAPNKISLPFFGLVFDGSTAIFVGLFGNKIRFFQENRQLLELKHVDTLEELIHRVVYPLLWHIKELKTYT